jgi:hypothetical protein
VVHLDSVISSLVAKLPPPRNFSIKFDLRDYIALWKSVGDLEPICLDLCVCGGVGGGVCVCGVWGVGCGVCVCVCGGVWECYCSRGKFCEYPSKGMQFLISHCTLFTWSVSLDHLLVD